MTPEKTRTQIFKVLKPVMGYVEGEEPTIVDLDEERETEYIGDGSLKFVSGDEPRTTKKKAPTPGQRG